MEGQLFLALKKRVVVQMSRLTLGSPHPPLLLLLPLLLSWLEHPESGTSPPHTTLPYHWPDCSEAEWGLGVEGCKAE